jgi:hypothetical protein
VGCATRLSLAPKCPRVVWPFYSREGHLTKVGYIKNGHLSRARVYIVCYALSGGSPEPTTTTRSQITWVSLRQRRRSSRRFVPSASEAAGSQPDGAIYKSSTGKRFRLRHAHWQPVIPRAPRAGTAAAATTAPAAKA